jgi:hypothetical protein
VRAVGVDAVEERSGFQVPLAHAPRPPMSDPERPTRAEGHSIGQAELFGHTHHGALIGDRGINRIEIKRPDLAGGSVFSCILLPVLSLALHRFRVLRGEWKRSAFANPIPR